MKSYCENCGAYAELYRDRATGMYICDDCERGDEPDESDESEDEE